MIEGKLVSTFEQDKSLRGTGIPWLADAVAKDTFIKRLILISYDTFVDLKNNKIESLKNKFHGTFYYIEIDNEET